MTNRHINLHHHHHPQFAHFLRNNTQFKPAMHILCRFYMFLHSMLLVNDSCMYLDFITLIYFLHKLNKCYVTTDSSVFKS